jgi:hypothetical protein
MFTGLTPSLKVWAGRERARGDRAAGTAAARWRSEQLTLAAEHIRRHLRTQRAGTVRLPSGAASRSMRYSP